MDSRAAAELVDLFEPYVAFPELYKNNFMTWHYITQGWSNYPGYVDYVKPATPLTMEEFEGYRTKWWSTPLFTSSTHLFNQLLGWILRGQITKLESNQWDLDDWNPEKMSNTFKQPLEICKILHALLHGSSTGAGWERID